MSLFLDTMADIFVAILYAAVALLAFDIATQRAALVDNDEDASEDDHTAQLEDEMGSARDQASDNRAAKHPSASTEIGADSAQFNDDPVPSGGEELSPSAPSASQSLEHRSATPATFTDLPRELRDQVYMYVLTESRPIPALDIKLIKGNFVWTASLRKPALGFASKTIGAEALHIYFSTNVFSLIGLANPAPVLTKVILR